MSNEDIRDRVKRPPMLTVEEDETAYALLSPDEYDAIPDHMKPARHSVVLGDAVVEALENAVKLMGSMNHVDALSQIRIALDAYRNQPAQIDTQGVRGGVKVRCVENNEVFASLAAAGRYAGVSSTTIRNHLDGKTGYPTVRGLTFIKE